MSEKAIIDQEEEDKKRKEDADKRGVQAKTEDALLTIFEGYNTEAVILRKEQEDNVKIFDKVMALATDFTWRGDERKLAASGQINLEADQNIIMQAIETLATQQVVIQLPRLFQFKEMPTINEISVALTPIISFLVNELDLPRAIRAEPKEFKEGTIEANVPAPVQVNNITPSEPAKPPSAAAIIAQTIRERIQSKPETSSQEIMTRHRVTDILEEMRQVQTEYLQFLDWLPSRIMQLQLDPEEHTINGYQFQAIIFLGKIRQHTITAMGAYYDLRIEQMNKARDSIIREALKSQGQQSTFTRGTQMRGLY